jgi:hypothetical protein
MSVVDRVLAVVAPAESAADRLHARARARASAAPGDWLSQVLDHHVQIDSAFAAVRLTTDAAARVAATRELGALLVAHAVAEELVIYPALAHIHAKGHAQTAYNEQSAAKLELGLLEYVRPMSQEYLDKLEHLRSSVLHHMYEEEGKWFLELKARLTLAEQDVLSVRYAEEFERHLDETPTVIGNAIPSTQVLGGGGGLEFSPGGP